MPQRIPQGFVVSAQQVDKKHILPWTPAHGPRLDLAQTDVAQREHAERLEQRSRNILDAESQRSLIGAARGSRLSALDLFSFDEKEASEVLLVIFDAGFQN